MEGSEVTLEGSEIPDTPPSKIKEDPNEQHAKIIDLRICVEPNASRASAYGSSAK
jgi:hypothetical protein